MSDDQFTRLINLFSTQIADLRGYMDERFDLLEKRLDFNEQHMLRGFEELRTEIGDVRQDVNQVRNVLDGVVGDIRDIKTELGAIGLQLDRHDQAITQLVDHAGVQLQYE